LRKKRRLRNRHNSLLTTETLESVMRVASFVGHVLKVTPYAKHAEPILSVTNAARIAFAHDRRAERMQDLTQQNLRLQITSLTSKLSRLDPQLQSSEYSAISSELDTLLNNLNPDTTN